MIANELILYIYDSTTSIIPFMSILSLIVFYIYMIVYLLICLLNDEIYLRTIWLDIFSWYGISILIYAISLFIFFKKYQSIKLYSIYQ
jgi:hypothetical protein